SVLYKGGQVAYSSSLFPQDVERAMRDRKVTLMFTVPMFLKILKNHIMREVENGGPVPKSIFETSMNVARFLPFKSMRRALFVPIHARLGGRLRGFVC